MGIEQDLQTNKYELDNEWVKQPNLVFTYTKEYAGKVKERDLLNETLKLVKSELKKMEAMIDLEVRADYTKFGFDKKPTEAAIASLVLLDYRRETSFRRVIETGEKLAEVNEEVNVLDGVRSALYDKREAIKGLQQLQTQEYYSESAEAIEALNKKMKEKK